jgi:hypothetical protein
MIERAFAEFTADTLRQVRAPGVAAARRRAEVRRRRRRMTRAAASAVLVLAGFGGYLAAAGPAAPTNPPATHPAPTTTPTTPPSSPVAVPPAPATSTSLPLVGVAYDAARLPTGSPGSGERRVRATSEQPKDGPGIFRTVCAFSHMRADDPVGAPGAAGRAPLYSFWGNTGTSSASTPTSVAASGNSTCRGGIVDRTAYYAPALINTRTGLAVAPTEVTVFHDTGRAGINPASIRPFPVGLRMRAGDPTATAYQGSTVGGWTCWEYYTGTFATIPTDCPAGKVRMLLFFPSCWDGVNLDSPDHHGHMAYPQNGRCPATHPVPLPEISYHVLYPVSPDLATSRLSTDMYGVGQPGGLSLHGYWVNGWDPDIQSAWVTHCVNQRVDCASHLLGDGRAISGEQ